MAAVQIWLQFGNAGTKTTSRTFYSMLFYRRINVYDVNINVYSFGSGTYFIGNRKIFIHVKGFIYIPPVQERAILFGQ